MSKDTKKTRTHDEYIKETFDEIRLRTRKGKKPLIHAAAKGEGVSVNAWLNRLIDNELERISSEEKSSRG